MDSQPLDHQGSLRIHLISGQFNRDLFFFWCGIFTFYEANFYTVWILILVLFHTNFVILDNLHIFQCLHGFICWVGVIIGLISLFSWGLNEVSNLGHIGCLRSVRVIVVKRKSSLTMIKRLMSWVKGEGKSIDLEKEVRFEFISSQFSSVSQSCPTLCDPMNCSTPGLPVHHKLPEFTQTHAHRVGDAIQPSHPLCTII